MRALNFLALGLLFSIGLGISGMTQPGKVLAFLDVTGAWDPALMFVMGGAVAITFIGYRWVLRRPMPVLADAFQIPTRRDIDGRLILGALMFGVGWGMAGFCTGPALAALGSGSVEVMVFAGAMFAGFWLQKKVS